jgi:hypothetical protein
VGQLLSIPIEAVNAYRESMEQQQLKDFQERVNAKLDQIEANSQWYASPEGTEFVKKVVATGLNVEYCDKIDFFTNAIVNGPNLGNDQAKRLKFVELIRSLSRSALQVLITLVNPSFRSHGNSPEALAGAAATALGWDPALVLACIHELAALGVMSSVSTWREGDLSGQWEPHQYYSSGIPSINCLTRDFVKFISNPDASKLSQ